MMFGFSFSEKLVDAVTQNDFKEVTRLFNPNLYNSLERVTLGTTVPTLTNEELHDTLYAWSLHGARANPLIRPFLEEKLGAGRIVGPEIYIFNAGYAKTQENLNIMAALTRDRPSDLPAISSILLRCTEAETNRVNFNYSVNRDMSYINAFKTKLPNARFNQEQANTMLDMIIGYRWESEQNRRRRLTSAEDTLQYQFNDLLNNTADEHKPDIIDNIIGYINHCYVSRLKSLEEDDKRVNKYKSFEDDHVADSAGNTKRYYTAEVQAIIDHNSVHLQHVSAEKIITLYFDGYNARERGALFTHLPAQQKRVIFNEYIKRNDAVAISIIHKDQAFDVSFLANVVNRIASEQVATNKVKALHNRNNIFSTIFSYLHKGDRPYSKSDIDTLKERAAHHMPIVSYLNTVKPAQEEGVPHEDGVNHVPPPPYQAPPSPHQNAVQVRRQRALSVDSGLHAVAQR